MDSRSKLFERVFDLSEAWPGAWFEEVIERSAELRQVTEVIGRNTMGLALVAGARIAGLSIDPRFPGLTSVEYSFAGEVETREALIPDFRRRIGTLLLKPLTANPLPKNPSAEQLQTYIGGRYLLEASLFGVRVVELRVGRTRSDISVDFSELRHTLSLKEFREVIDDRVRSELGLFEPERSASINLALVDVAAAANANREWDATITLLTPWLTPISILLRSGEAEELGSEVHERLSAGLELLGSAYANSGDTDSACEVFRLGVQWAGESSQAAVLYLRLADTSMSSERHGEAIGLLRRAITLGASESDALPRLAHCYLERRQYLASMVCLQLALDAGTPPASVEALEAEVRDRLAEPWVAFEALLGLKP